MFEDARLERVSRSTSSSGGQLDTVLNTELWRQSGDLAPYVISGRTATKSGDGSAQRSPDSDESPGRTKPRVFEAAAALDRINIAIQPLV